MELKRTLKLAALAFGVLAVTALPSVSRADSPRHKERVQDRREIRTDVRAIHRHQAELRFDRRQLRRDRWTHASRIEMIKDREALRHHRKELFGNRREFRRDVRDARMDRRDHRDVRRDHWYSYHR